MISKSLRIYGLALMAAVVLYACQCKEQGAYLQIYSLYVNHHSNLDWEWNDTLYSKDTLFVDVALSLQCIAQSNSFHPIISAAMATSMHCPCGEKGFRQPITDLKIMTDSVYGAYAAGTEITQLFTGYSWTRETDGSQLYTYYEPSVFKEKLLQSVSAQNGSGGGNLNLFLTQKPQDTLFHSFSFQLTTTDSVYRISSGKFKWI